MYNMSIIFFVVFLFNTKRRHAMTTILGIRLDNRTQTAVDFQKTLTQYGCSIKTRLGLHEVANNMCAPNGLIILEIINDDEGEKLKNDLLQISGLELQSMKFN